VWTLAALFLGIGEVLTAGFFLLPFSIGAAVAAALAWFEAPIVVQWLTFLGVSVVALVWMQRFARRQRPSPPVGENRYLGKTARVIEAIDPGTGSGRVHLDTENWRASASELIPTGSQVRVVDVQGTRLVVQPVDKA